MKISKANGKSPYYEFNPTKKDKIMVSIYLATFVLSPVYTTGVEMLLSGE